jgi:putative NADH-flavin reductase/pimeloyl-ACP methyl ester carboxylesterase
MKIALFGAGGHIGRRILEEALSRGHQITAVVRDSTRLSLSHERLNFVTGDVLDPASVATAVAGQDVVISAVGPGPNSSPQMVVDAARSLIGGLTRAGVRRLMVVGGAGSLEVAPGVQLVDTPEFPAAWRAIALAHREALEVYRSADLDWTYLSPPTFIEPGRRTGRYRLGSDQLLTNEQGESRISMEDYAVALLDEGESPQFVRRRMTVANYLASCVTHTPQTNYRTAKVKGLDIFYREAGPKNAPTVLLLHGFPTSSHMFRNLIPALADQFYLVAPDYPGFGNSSMPKVHEFNYTFDNLAEVVDRFTQALGLARYTLCMQDYGAPVGFRLAVKHPERVQGLIIQNGNAYEEGIAHDAWAPIKAYWQERTEETTAAVAKFLTLEFTKWQYTHGTRNPEAISPDNWLIAQHLLDRPGNREIQLQLFYDYRSNPPRYPQWQAYLREFQPPTLVVWGKNDPFFPAAGAYPYQRDLKSLEFHLLETGHFALEEDGDLIARLMRRFLETRVLGKEEARAK